MANSLKYFLRRRVVNQFSLFIGIVGVVVILLANNGDASPSSPRQRKSASSGSRTLRSARIDNNVPSGDKSVDLNATMDEGKMCSLAGGDRPACRKAGLDMKKISLELIRRDILKKLRLDENKLPNRTVIPPSYLSDFVGMQGDSPIRDDSHDDEHATTEKIIAFSKPGTLTVGGKSSNVHHFSFSEKMSNMKIESAKMYVHVRYINNHHNSSDRRNTNFNIRIKKNHVPNKGESPIFIDYGKFKPIHRPGGFASSMPHGRHSHSKWVEINLQDFLSKWIATSNNSRKITLAIDAVDNDLNPSQEVTVVTSSESDVNTQFPFIEVHVSEAGRSRQPRNIGMTCDENSQETRCCKYPLTVDFEEFGWDWIIAPKKYDANYCSGECPFAFLQEYPHNHIVQQAVPSGVGGPCCAARKMSSISMLYFDGDSNILFSVLPGMVVETCGCS